jgi:hypothetical protein
MKSSDVCHNRPHGWKQKQYLNLNNDAQSHKVPSKIYSTEYLMASTVSRKTAGQIKAKIKFPMLLFFHM